MGKDEDKHFVRVELPTALRGIYARASIDKTLARTVLFDQLAYVGPDASKESSRADVLKALALCFKAVNSNSHDDPAGARRILESLSADSRSRGFLVNRVELRESDRRRTWKSGEEQTRIWIWRASRAVGCASRLQMRASATTGAVERVTVQKNFGTNRGNGHAANGWGNI